MSPVSHINALLTELFEIYEREAGVSFLPGISAAIDAVSGCCEIGDSRFREAASIYRTLAGSKSGFSDFYIDRPTVEERVIANGRLDDIRRELWKIFGF